MGNAESTDASHPSSNDRGYASGNSNRNENNREQANVQPSNTRMSTKGISASVTSAMSSIISSSSTSNKDDNKGRKSITSREITSTTSSSKSNQKQNQQQQQQKSRERAASSGNTDHGEYDDDDNESDIQPSKSKLSKANIDGRKASASRPQRGSNLSASSRDSGDNSKSQQQPSYWQMAKDGYEELVNAIIRPPRYDHYKISDLGSKVFRLEGKYYERKDMELVNKRGMKLQCSHWLPSSQSGSKTTKPIPCIIYLHGNSSCRLEAMDSLPTVLGAGCSLFALDCAGSGKSDGEFISLGVYEREDVQCAVDYLRSNPDLVSGIGIWGRSMGSVTALMFADRDPTIGCLILDSPFTRLRQLARELVESAQLNIPKFAVGLGLRMVRSSVKSRAGFDINDLEPIKYAPNCHMPALFAAANGDMFIRPHHAKEIYDQYAGDKNIINFDGDHNSQRPDFFHASVLIFIVNTLVTPCENAWKDLEKAKKQADAKSNDNNNNNSSSAAQTSSKQTSTKENEEAAKDPWNGALFAFPAPMAASNSSSAGLVKPLSSSTTNGSHIQSQTEPSRLQRFNVNGSSLNENNIGINGKHQDDYGSDIDDLGEDPELMEAIRLSLMTDKNKVKE